MVQNAGLQIARFTPQLAVGAAEAVPSPIQTRQPERRPRPLAPREKAAVIVRLLLGEGDGLPLASLPDDMQATLTQQIGEMRLVDRATLMATVAEFVDELEQVGLAFPGGIDGAIDLMDGHISPATTSHLRRLAGGSRRQDPWERIAEATRDQLLGLMAGESAEVAAVILSKLPTSRAADLLSGMAGDRARRIAFAMSMTAEVHPDTVRRIGGALVQQLENRPARAFGDAPAARVSAILNVASPATRDDLLAALTVEDQLFADQVRKSLFTFAHIPVRLVPRDVPKILRAVDQAQMVTALAAAQGASDTAPAVDFFLSNISQRMAEMFREEMVTRGQVRQRDGDAAMIEVIAAIRDLEAQGEIKLVVVSDEEDAV